MYNLYEFQHCTDNGIELMYVTAFCYEKDWRGVMHSHDFVEIFFCVNGQCDFKIGDHHLSAQRNDFIIINPYIQHTEISSTISPVEWIVIGIKGIRSVADFSNVQEEDDEKAGTNALNYCHGSFETKKDFILNLLIMLVDEAKNKAPFYNDACMQLTKLLLTHISRFASINLLQKQVNADKEPIVKYSNWNIKWIKQYIDDNYAQKLNLDALSVKIRLNKYGLIREFKRIYHCTPIEYMLHLRFNEAKLLLRTTDHSIAYIARVLGFSSGNYFSQRFYKREAMSPTDYRSSVRAREGISP